MINWGSSGETVYQRTYSRTKAHGEREDWTETVSRVVDGNLALNTAHLLPNERDDLTTLMQSFKILPAGRHLWACGVPGRQFLFNCWVSGWTERPSDHFRFSFLRLMEGGGVGANYSNHLLPTAEVQGTYRVHIVCDPEHPDYQKMEEAGLLSHEFGEDWSGAFAIEDSREGWANGLVDLIDTYYRDDVKHVNRVYDVSYVRHEGARLKTFGGRASGPLPFARMMREVSNVLNSLWDEDLSSNITGLDAMEIDHAIATCVVSGGNRRSARMSIMHWADPQIEKFIHIKQDSGSHWTTNISVEVDDEFFRRQDGNPESPSTIAAKGVLDDVSRGMLTNGEPGIWNSSLSNEGEPNPVTCTNPCGEIALEPWEPCNLGHINLAAYVRPNGELDWPGLEKAHRLMTRFLIRATFGDVADEKSAAVLARNRRIGVGHFGFASMLGQMGIRYADSPEHLTVRMMLMDMAGEVEDTAIKYAHDLRIPVPVKTRTVAPTGTIAKMPGVSEGIHPIFAKYFIRRIRFSTADPDQRGTVEDYRSRGYHVEWCKYAPLTKVVEIPTKDSLMAEVESRYGQVAADDIVQSSAELTLGGMLAVQEMYQELWADNAVSYTANIQPAAYTADQIAVAIREFGPSLKGLTCFPDLGMEQSPYQHLTKEEYQEYTIRHVSDSVDENCLSGACPVR